MRTVRLVIAAFLFGLPLYTSAWGVQGHRITGGIAETYLTPTARKAIRAILGNESLAMASTWADFIRSDSSYNYLGSWHYINLPAGLSATAFREYLRRDTGTDVYTQINFVASQLKVKNLPKAKKIFYLRLLIHFAGDIHQPMHAAHADDKGGNDFRVQWFNTPSNLHRLWDENLVDFQQLSFTEYIAAINHATAAQVKQWQKQPVSDWLYESYQISEKVYQEIHPDDKLGYAYNFYHIETVNARLLQGGVRLAGLLNSIFG